MAGVAVEQLIEVRAGRGIMRIDLQGPAVMGDGLIDLALRCQRPRQIDVGQQAARINGQGGIEMRDRRVELSREQKSRSQIIAGRGIVRISTTARSNSARASSIFPLTSSRWARLQ